MSKFIFCVLMLLSSGIVFSQSRDNPPYKTPNTYMNPNPNPEDYRPKQKEIRYIIKKDTKGFLPGNKCFEEVTKKMGFQYLAVPKGQSYYSSEWERNLHNLGVKLVVLFKNGPFWKLKINKTYRKCRFAYGDYIAP